MSSIPHELIRDVKIRTRAAVGLTDYDPSDPTLPSMPSLSAEVAALDPSPADLRCQSCKGRLLRGSDSLICVYCGRVPRKDVVREPLSFSGTVGYTWLLRSLGVDGSELVEPQRNKSGQDKGHSSSSPPMPLSEFLNFKIPWTVEAENQETSDSDKHLSHGPLSFTGVALDNFFVKSQVEAVLSDTSSEQKSPRNHIETALGKDVHTLGSRSVSASARSFEAAESSHEGKSGEAQWEADFQFAEGNTFPDLQQPSMDIEQLRLNKESVVPDTSNEPKVIHDHVETSGNKDIAARDSSSLFQSVQSYEDVGSSTKEEASEDFSEWDADFQSAALDNTDGNFKSSGHVGPSLSDSETKFQDNFTHVEDKVSTNVDSVLGQANDGKVKDVPASVEFDEWSSGDLLNNLSSKDSHTVGEFDASTSTKNDVDDDTYKDTHDSPATSDFFEDFQWQNKGSDIVVKKSNSVEVEKQNEDLVESWDNVTGLGSVEVASEAKIADIGDVKTKDEPTDEDSFDEWGGFASSSLRTADEIIAADLKENETQNRKHETTNDDLFDEWGDFGSLNVSSGTKSVGVTEIMTTTEPNNEEPLRGWGDFTLPSESKASNMTYHEEKGEVTTIVDDDIFEGWGNFTSSTSMKATSEGKTKEEPTKMDGDLFEGWGNFTSSTHLQVSSETKSGDILEMAKEIEKNKKVGDDYTFEGWGDSNKSSNGEPTKPMDNDPFEEWGGFTGPTNLQVSTQIQLDQLDNEVSISEHRSSDMDFFKWDDNRRQGLGFDGFSQPTSAEQSSSILTQDYPALSENSTSDWFNEDSSLPLDSSVKSNKDKENVMNLMSQMHDLSFMLADELCIPNSTSNTSPKD